MLKFLSGKKIVKLIVIATVAIGYCVPSSKAFCEERKILSVKQSVILNVPTGSRIGEIGIQDNENASAVGQSINPIYIYRNETILVGDSINHRVQEFDKSGKPIRSFLLRDINSHIQSITADNEGNIYVISGPNKAQLNIFKNKDKQATVIDLSSIGRFEKDFKGKVKLNKAASLNGAENKVLLDSKKRIYVLGSDLIMIDEAGKVLKRWGPDVRDFLIDIDDKIIINYSNLVEILDKNHKLIKKLTLYDKTGKYINPEWNSITWPEHIDALGNYYGFLSGKEDYLAQYSMKNQQLNVFPLKRSDFIGASWTIDSAGNVYIAEASTTFTITKISLGGSTQ